MPNLNIAVLGSTNGSTFQTLFPLLKGSALPVEIQLVLSDRANAGILEFARAEKLPFCYLGAQKTEAIPYDEKLKATLEAYPIDLVLLIGFMRIVGFELTQTWKMLNVHPSLLPKHAGLMDLAVHQAVIDSGDKKSGCSVHYVTETIDGGPIVYQACCEVDQHETAESLKQKVQALEASALLAAIKRHIEDINDQQQTTT